MQLCNFSFKKTLTNTKTYFKQFQSARHLLAKVLDQNDKPNYALTNQLIEFDGCAFLYERKICNWIALN